MPTSALYQVCSLPDEVLLHVLEDLSPNETNTLIRSLTDILDQLPNAYDSQQMTEVKLLINLAYRRLYKGKSLILSDKASNGNYPGYDNVLTFEKFQQRFASKAHQTTSEAIDESVFKQTRPHSLDFKFMRSANDYTTFVGDLYKLNQILELIIEGGEITDYLGLVCQLGFYLDGNTVSIESPTSLLTAILKTLINLVSDGGAPKNSSLSTKFCNITIKSTDIGNYYVAQWGQLLSRFTNVTTLDLSDNIIQLDSNNRTQGTDPSMSVDLLANYFTWPPNLKVLSLEKNLISYISKKFIDNLPKSLESLLLANNRLASLGCNDEEQFVIPRDLPNLKMLDISGNYSLIFINTEIFKNVKESGVFVELNARGCNIEENNLRQLKQVSMAEYILAFV